MTPEELDATIALAENPPVDWSPEYVLHLRALVAEVRKAWRGLVCAHCGERVFGDPDKHLATCEARVTEEQP